MKVAKLVKCLPCLLQNQSCNPQNQVKRKKLETVEYSLGLSGLLS